MADNAASADAAEKKPATGKLTVIVRPWGQVAVDGVVRGNTPKLRVLELTGGRHMVTITHPAYGTTQKFVTVRTGQNTEITFDLRKP